MRRCTKCGEERPRTSEHFPHNKRMKDGLSSWCRPCHRAQVKARHLANPAPGRARAVAWQRAHPERARENWRGRDRAARVSAKREAKQRRRARLHEAPGVASRFQIEARVAYFGWRCWMCGAPWEHIDHVIPLSKGGSNWPSNLRPACGPCNLRKGARRIEMYPIKDLVAA